MVSVRVGMLFGFLPAATVGFIPTVFVGWVVGLVCGVAGLLEFFASFIGVSLLGFKSLLSITFFIFYSLGVAWIFLFVAIDVFMMTLITDGDCLYLL